MSRAADHFDPVETKITLGLLNAVEEDGTVTQRRLASDLGIALGLVNAYLKRCVNKGLIKVQHVPSHRYAYYLTPKGFTEKSHLTASYLVASFDFFRQARASCEEALHAAARMNWKNVGLVGRSDLAEIGIICALDHPVNIVGLVDKGSKSAKFAGVPVVKDIAALADTCDGVLISDIETTQRTYEAAVHAFGASRVLVPSILMQAVKQPMRNGADGP